MQTQKKPLVIIGLLIAIAIVSVQLASAPSWSKSFDSTTKTLSVKYNNATVATIQQISDISGLTKKEEVFNFTFYGYGGVTSYGFNGLSDMNFRWEKSFGIKDIIKYETYLLKNISYNTTILDYGWNNRTVWNNYTLDNVTWINETVWKNESIVIGNHSEIQYKDNWIPLILSGKTIYKGESYIIKVIFYKEAEIGNFSIKTIPTFIYGVEEDRMTWWNTSWQSRIDNTLSNGSRPYQISLNITNGTGTNNGTHVYLSCQSVNCSDIRFTLDNTTELPYWIETNISSGVWGKGWVNVTGNGTVNLYSGAAGVSDASNGANTFAAFDVFDTDTWVDTGSLMYVDTTNKSLYTKADRSSTAHRSVKTVNALSDFYLTFDLNVTTYDGNSGTLYVGIADADAQFPSDMLGVAAYQYSGQPLGYAYKREGGTENTLDETGMGTSYPRNGKVTIWRLGNTVYTSWIVGAAVAESLWSDTNLGNLNYLTVFNNNDGVLPSNWIESKIDNIIYRKYASPEPVWATWGSENQQSDATPPASISNLQNTTGNFYHNWSWTNPLDSDFNRTMIYLNGVFVTNVSNITVFYNLTVNAHNTSTISTHTVDNSSNVNSTWVNHTSSIPNNPITISDVSTSYTLNEGQSLSIDANYTDVDSDAGLFFTNATKGSINSGTGIYTLNTVDGDQGIYNWNISVTDNNGSTSVSDFIITINYALLPPTEPGGVYAFRNDSIPSNATILEYKNNSLLTTVTTLDWDNITSNNWTTLLSRINYSYTNGIRTSLRLNLGGNYASTDIQNSTKNNITTFFIDLTSDPYQSDVQWIELNFTNLTASTGDKRSYANITAKNISEQSGNKFPVYTVQPLTSLDADYVKSSPLIYLNILNNSDFISQESITTRGNTTLSRVYSGNESTLSLISSYKLNIFNRLRGTISASHPSESYATNVNNGTGGYDLILFNNLSTTQNRTAANIVGTYLDVNNDIMQKLSTSGTLHFNVSGENFSYIINEPVNKIILNDTAHKVYGAETNYNNSFTYGNNQYDSWIYAGTNNDIKAELFDPTYTQNNTFMIHYEWINASKISNYTPYNIIIIADKNAGEINTTINKTNSSDTMKIPFVYFSVGDYTDNGGAWVTAKKSEMDWALSRGLNAFVDGIDIAVQYGGNFSADVKSVISYGRVNNSKKVICNTYTAYESFATVCDVIMKESAFSRWGGTVTNPVYSWEDMDIEKQRADYYTSHNIPVILMSFGDATDYEKLYFDFLAAAVLYGYNGNNSFRYGQPNFQLQSEIYVPNLGTILENGYTETSSSDWNRLYSNGRVHIDPVTHTAWIDNNKVVNSMSVDIYLYSGGTGSGDRNVTLTINSPNGTFYNRTYGSETIGQWGWRNIPIPTSEYKEHGQYNVYFATRPIAGGWNFVGKDNTAKSGTHTWYDTSGANIPAEGNDSNYVWSPYARDINYMVRLNVDYNTTLQVDTFVPSTITQTDSRTSGNRTVTVSSASEYNTSIYSKTVQLTTTTISNLWFKATNGTWISANVPNTNVSDINSTNPSWTETTIEGFTYGAIKQYIDTNSWWIRLLFPHLSTQEAMVGENVAPSISNVTNQTINENGTAYVDIDGSDVNSDMLTFSTNSTNFTDFDSTTGKGNWTTNFASAGIYYVDFGVSDGLNNTNQTMMITITDVPLAITTYSPSGDKSVSQDTSQQFNITTSRTVNATWFVNSTQVQTNISVTLAVYTNSSNTTGTFNITVSATDGIDTVSRQWNLTVTAPSQTTTPATTTSSSKSTGSSFIPYIPSETTPTTTPLPTQSQIYEQFIPTSSPYQVQKPLDLSIYSIQFSPSCTSPMFLNRTNDNIFIISQCTFDKLLVNFIVPKNMEVSQLIEGTWSKSEQQIVAKTLDDKYYVIQASLKTVGIFTFTEKTLMATIREQSFKDTVLYIDRVLYDKLMLFVRQISDIKQIDNIFYEKLTDIIKNSKSWILT